MRRHRVLLLSIAAIFLLPPLGALWVMYDAFSFGPRPTSPEKAGLRLPPKATNVHAVHFPFPGGDDEIYVAAQISQADFAEIVKGLGAKPVPDENKADYIWTAFRVDPEYRIADWWTVSDGIDDKTYFWEGEDDKSQSDEYGFLKYENGYLYYHKAVR